MIRVSISASAMEIQSLAVIEALASGTPVVGLSNEAVAELAVPVHNLPGFELCIPGSGVSGFHRPVVGFQVTEFLKALDSEKSHIGVFSLQFQERTERSFGLWL
jgi:hypothetical protein